MQLLPVPDGGVIGLVSPASPSERDRVDAGIKFLHENGYVTKLFPNALASHQYLAGSDDRRIADLHAAFADPDVDAVLCLRGGYGCARIVGALDLTGMASSRKPFLGYSDITTLHLAFESVGFPTFHAPMLVSLTEPRPSWVHQSLFGALKNDLRVPVGAANGECVVGGVVSSSVTGGCLSLLTDSIGTKYPFIGSGKIVLIEDVNEKPHRIDAMLTHLINARALERVAGIIVGEMTGTDAERTGDDPTWREIVIERLAPLKVPMIVNYPFGHIEAPLTIPLGIVGTLNADKGTLTFPSS